MTIFNALTLVGGLCLFLFGMNLMGQALERLLDLTPAQARLADEQGDNLIPLSAVQPGMMLRLAFDMGQEAGQIEKAVRTALAEGFRTADIMEPGKELLGCTAMGNAVVERL